MAEAEMSGLDILNTKMPNLDKTKWTATESYPIPTGVKGMMDDLKNVQSAATPVISAQPQGGQYNVGNTAAALTVEATGDATGLLSYQWYKSTTSATDGFTAIAGATGASYTPDTAAAGNVWYYCKVTNTNSIFGGKSTKDSTAAMIHVHDWDETKYAKNEEYHWNYECKLEHHETVTEPAKMGSYERHTTFGNHICSECEFVGALSYYDASKGVDKSFYNASTYASTNEFHLTNANQLFGFAELVNSGVNFQGKTVYLDVNVVINQGDAETWKTTVPANKDWAPIGTSSNPFKGTLNGNGHYVSGLYSKRAKDNALIAYANGATVKNLAVINSYLENTGSTSTSNRGSGQRLSAFVATGENVALSNLYSDATLKNAGTDLGGIIGYAKGATTVDSCAFAGTILSDSFERRNYGGIVGYNETGVLTVSNCIYSGVMNTKTHLQGGIVGRSNVNGTSIKNCVSVGTVKSNHGSINTDNAIIGAIKAASGATTITVENCYYLTGSHTCGFKEAVNGIAPLLPETNVVTLDASVMQGHNALTTMSNLDSTKWTATAGYPVPTGIKEIYAEKALFEAKRDAQN
jgi:hypothetical protein